MTCDEFRKTIMHTTPNDATRANRACVIKHFNDCNECQIFFDLLDAIIGRGDDDQEKAAADATDKLLEEDYKDEEFVRIVSNQ